MHPAGRYNFNSVIDIIKVDRSGFNPLPCKRLYRLTSGLMLIAKTPNEADEIMGQLKTRTIKKTYLARVKGRFPDCDVLCTEPSSPSRLSSVSTVSAPMVNLPEPSPAASRTTASPPQTRPSPCASNQLLKHSRSSAARSKFACTSNDLAIRSPLAPIYSSAKVFPTNLGAFNTCSAEDVISRLQNMGKEALAMALDYYEDMVDRYVKRKGEEMTGEVCAECQALLYSDPGEHELGIYLHARRYECIEGAWAYETGVLDWVGPSKGEGEAEKEVGAMGR
ncbi:hypothetical protein BDZ91DRAFT_96683 [Kalaharituber pfeilii]|nr:hypothetical protein BDZ91DRAFT_96683 [Kalaharituber pfeilii]